MKVVSLLFCTSLGLFLTGCGQGDDERGAMENFEQNSQEFHNTATDPAGPREISPPSNLANE